jgi:hypothetical protein
MAARKLTVGTVQACPAGWKIGIAIIFFPLKNMYLIYLVEFSWCEHENNEYTLINNNW